MLEKAVDVVLDEIVIAMARRDRVELREFGSFYSKDRVGRIGRNPRSGVKVEVPQKTVPAFRPSKEISKRLNSVDSIPETPERNYQRSRSVGPSGSPLLPVRGAQTVSSVLIARRVVPHPEGR